MKNGLGENEEKTTSIRIEVVEKISALVTAAFGLVAALAWNEAIKAVFKEIFGTSDTVIPMIIYALSVTIIAVILTVIVARAASKAKSKL